jgi:uncharacterized membrane protein
VRWVALGVLVVAGGVLALSWGDLPSRWAVHWGLHDRPDLWVTKSVASVAAPLVIGFFVWMTLEAVARWMKANNARTDADARVPPEWLAVQWGVLRAVSLAVAVLTAGIAIALPLWRPSSSLPIAIGALADLGLIIGTATVWAARRTQRLRAAGVAIPEGYDGVFYKNPRDPRLWVPKAAGMGWTINFAHRWAWPAMIALLAPAVLALLLVALLR